MMDLKKVEHQRKCHAGLDSASNKIEELRDPETSSELQTA